MYHLCAAVCTNSSVVYEGFSGRQHAYCIICVQLYALTAQWYTMSLTAGRLAARLLYCYCSHRRSVEVLCMLYKIRCNPMHPLNGALPGPYVPARVTRGALVSHRYTYAPPRCRTLQYSRTFIPFSVSLWNDLASSVFDGVGLAGFKSRANASLLA